MQPKSPSNEKVNFYNNLYSIDLKDLSKWHLAELSTTVLDYALNHFVLVNMKAVKV